MILMDKTEKIYPIIKEGWNFAKEHTALFLGISTACVSVVSLLLNVLVFSYQFGYYHYGYNVSSALLKSLYKDGISAVYIIWGIAVTCLLVIYTLLGVEAYKNHKYRRFLVGTFFVLFCCMACFYFLIFINRLQENFIEYWLEEFSNIAIWAILFTIILNTLMPYCILDPTQEDKLSRMRIEVRRIEDKLLRPKTKEIKRVKLIAQKEEKEEKIREIEKEKAKSTKFETVKKDRVKQIVFFCIIVAVILVPIIMFTGAINANSENNYIIIVNREDICTEMEKMVPTNKNANYLVILYQNDSTAIVSPCHIENDKIEIYNDIQRILQVEDVIFYYGAYHRI